MYNINNEVIDIEIIRFFSNNDNEYLIYSLINNDSEGEIDGSGYNRLYASKIVGDELCIISDENEWLLVKDVIKTIIKNNRDGLSLEVFDLGFNKLKDLIIKNSRAFKLQGNLVNLLAENKQSTSYEEEQNLLSSIPGVADLNDEEELYEDVYEDVYEDEYSEAVQYTEEINQYDDQPYEEITQYDEEQWEDTTEAEVEEYEELYEEPEVDELYQLVETLEANINENKALLEQIKEMIKK